MNLKYRIVFSMTMALILSSLMTGWVTFLNLGMTPLYLYSWGKAFISAWPAAATIAFVFAPIIHKLCAPLNK